MDIGNFDPPRPLIEQMAVAYATQIEEQQAEIERLISRGHDLDEMLDDKIAEIARLTDENITLQTRYEQLEIHNIKLDAKIVRLTALKTPASRQLLNVTKGALDSAEAEVARLQAAFLKYIASENECYAWQRREPMPCHPEKCGCLVELHNALANEQEVK